MSHCTIYTVPRAASAPGAAPSSLWRQQTPQPWNRVKQTIIPVDAADAVGAVAVVVIIVFGVVGGVAVVDITGMVAVVVYGAVDVVFLSSLGTCYFLSGR